MVAALSEDRLGFITINCPARVVKPLHPASRKVKLSMPNVTVKGVYDLHVHSGPDVFDRIGDEAEIAALCRDAGMAGVAFKVHHENTVARAYYAAKLSPGIACYGTICLNHGVGGINPGIVETVLRMGGKIVWMPTNESA